MRSTDYLHRLGHGVKGAVPGCTSASVTIMLDGRPQTAANTSVRALQVDAMQYAAGDGPCLDAFRRVRENLLGLSAAQER